MKEIIANEAYEFLKQAGFETLYHGNPEIRVSTVASIARPKPHAIMFIERNRSTKLDVLHDVIVITSEESDSSKVNDTCGVICVNEPREAFYRVVNTLMDTEQIDAAISDRSHVLTDAIGDGVRIGDFCYIDKDVVIEKGVKIGHHVIISGMVHIAKQSVIHSGVIIGEEALGTVKDASGINKQIRHYGGVVLGKDVEVYSGAAIHRGSIDDTTIGDHCRIGPNSIVGHNCIVGENSILAAGVTLCGGVHVSAGCYIGTGTIVKERIDIGNDAFTCMGAVITRDVPEGGVADANLSNVLQGEKARIFQSFNKE